MRATLQQLLELTRLVFAGTITRAELSRRSTHEQAFVATAIMLASRQGFLDDNNTVVGPYNRVLEALLSAGTVNWLAGEEGFKSGDALVQAARSAGLYRPTPGLGGIKPIVLTPPAELAALVQELGCTPAIAAFLRDAETGAEQERLWHEEHEAIAAEKRARQSYQDHMERVLSETEEKFGPDGLRDLRARIEQQLRR